MFHSVAGKTASKSSCR